MRSTSAALAFALLTACGNAELTPQRPRIFIEAAPGVGQTSSENPAGLDLGVVPLFGVETARFTVRNRGTAALNITGFVPLEVSAGTYEIVEIPERLGPGEDGELRVDFSPSADGVLDEARFELTSDDDEPGLNNEFVVRGEGLFVGNPTLEVCYNGECRPTAGDCVDGVCALAALDFGNVPLGGLGSQVVTLRNRPEEGSCRAPPDSPECTRVCRLRFAPNPEGENTGFALESGSDFSIVGSVQLPFSVDKPLNGCPADDELDVLLRIDAGDTQRVVTDTLILETNDPSAALVRIPLTASLQPAPVAVASLRACDIAEPERPCSIAGDIRPLERFYLDGSASFDPEGRAITSYSWEIIEAPEGLPLAEVAPQDTNTATPSFNAPVAGTYRVRLTVENELGVRSGVSETSDIDVVVKPESALSVELLWRSGGAVDLDLHLIRPTDGHRVCDDDQDCYWRTCRPSCGVDPDCPEVRWVTDDPPFQGGNPRLDRDEIEGPGPETFNVDAPRAGEYRVYVHYYGLNNPVVDEPTSAILRVLLDGVPRAEFRRILQRNEVWRMADIVWDDALGGSVEALQSDGEGQGEARILDVCDGSGLEFELLQ